MRRTLIGAFVLAALLAGCSTPEGVITVTQTVPPPTAGTPAMPLSDPFSSVTLTVPNYGVSSSGCGRTVKGDTSIFQHIELRIQNNGESILQKSSSLQFRAQSPLGTSVLSCQDTFQDIAANKAATVMVVFEMPLPKDNKGCAERIGIYRKTTDGPQRLVEVPITYSSDGTFCASSRTTERARPQVAFTSDELGTTVGGVLTVVSITNGPLELSDIVVDGSATSAGCQFNGAPRHSGQPLAATGILKAGDQISCSAAGVIKVGYIELGMTLYSGSFS